MRSSFPSSSGHPPTNAGGSTGLSPTVFPSLLPDIIFVPLAVCESDADINWGCGQG